MRIVKSKEYKSWLFRFFNKDHTEVAYAAIGISGLKAEVEFPSDWHEEPRAWLRLGFGLFRVAVSVPWKKVVPDEFQCSGPIYGFSFFDDGLHLHWGKMKGTRDDPFTIIRMPWAWRFIKHEYLGEATEHSYCYTKKDGEIQNVVAIIRPETRTWWRAWIWPFMRHNTIDVQFSDEVGERSGTWKGGCVGCSYLMNKGETPLQTLRRMENERKF